MRVAVLAVLALVATVTQTSCAEEHPPCDPGAADPTAILGTGVDEAFDAIEPGDSAGLVTAPQGGMGVSVRVLTTGLDPGSVDVLLDTRIDGETTGSFLNEGVRLYCQEDDVHGMIWGVVVGFDQDDYGTNDELLGLNGQEVDLVVTITDKFDVSAVGIVPVTIEVGG